MRREVICVPNIQLPDMSNKLETHKERRSIMEYIYSLVQYVRNMRIGKGDLDDELMKLINNAKSTADNAQRDYKSLAVAKIKASRIDVDNLYVKHLEGADGTFKGTATIVNPENEDQQMVFGVNPLTNEFGLWATIDGGATYKKLADYFGLNGGSIVAGSQSTETDAYTSLLLHFYGDNNSVNFINSSAYPQNVTAYGNAKISTAQSKFNGCSGYFDGSGDYLSIPDNAIYAFGSGDFTIDCWARFNDLSGTKMIISQGEGYSSDIAFYLYASSDGKLRFIYTLNGTTQTSIISTAVLSTGAWFHLAVVRNGSTITLYINGAPVGSGSIGTSAIHNSSLPLNVGAYGGANFMNGYIDELRVSKGIARWTANFTPPTEPYAA